MKLGEPLPVRSKVLEELRQEQASETYRVRVQGQRRALGIHRLSLDFPKYRLDNGRTISAQTEYVATHELSTDFFKRDAESIEAQRSQHSLLYKMCVESSPNLIKYFAEAEQDEPLVLDSNGFVVNGNRRLCAMRSLFDQNPDSYARFSHIDVVILPPGISKRDIYALEVGLQLEEDVRQDYTWLDEASMIRRGRTEFCFPDQELATLYGKSVRKLREMLQNLELAEQYLESRGVPGEYHRVEDSELAFDKIREGRNKSVDEVGGAVFEKISHALIDDPDTGLGRLYGVIPDVQEYLAPIAVEIREQISATDSGDTEASHDEGISLLTPEGSSYSDISIFVDKPENKERIRRAAVEVIENERAKRKIKERSRASFEFTKQANTKLKDALNAMDQESNIAGISEQIDEIEETISRVRQRLSEHA